jgi:hypothetical protein
MHPVLTVLMIFAYFAKSDLIGTDEARQTYYSKFGFPRLH